MTLYYSLVSSPARPLFPCFSVSSIAATIALGAVTQLLEASWPRANFPPRNMSNYLTEDRICLGVSPSRIRDGRLHGPHRPASLHRQAEDLHFHIGKSGDSQVAIRFEGMHAIKKKNSTTMLQR